MINDIKLVTTQRLILDRHELCLAFQLFGTFNSKYPLTVTRLYDYYTPVDIKQVL